MMNKKGQVLVIFVLILPLIMIFLGLVIDIGNSLVMAQKYENTVVDIVVYNFQKNETEIVDDNLNEEDSENLDDYEEQDEPVQKEVDLSLIERNIKNSIDNYEEINVKVEDDILVVNIKSLYKGIFSKIFNIGLNTINIEVKYDIKNKKIVRE